MPPSILSSNLINIPVLDLILSSPQTALNQPYHLQLLHTKLAILTNRPSQPKRRGFAADLEILETRLEVARVALCLSEGSAGSIGRGSGISGGQGIGIDAGPGQEGSSSTSRDLVPRPIQSSTSSTSTSLSATQAQAGPSKSGSSPVPNYTLAEGELGIVEKECKGLTKRLCREIRARTDRARARDEDQRRDDVPGPSRTSSGTSTSTSTSTAEEGPSSTTSDSELRSPDVEEGYPSTETTPTQAPVPAFEKSTTLDPPTTSLSLHSLTPDDLNIPTSDTEADADAGPTPPTPPTPGKYQARLQTITDLRIRGLRLMADIQGMQGRPERKVRWEGLALKLQAGTGSGSSSSSGPGAGAIGES